MVKQNRIVIFTGAFESTTGFLIALATRCPFVHAGIFVAADGRWWHSSETIGRFDLMDVEAYAHRDCVMFEFAGDLSGWLENMQGTEYDWRGVFGWLVRLNNPEKFYCFEAAQEALQQAGVIDEKLKSLSGCDVRNMAKGGIYYGQFKDLCP